MTRGCRRQAPQRQIEVSVGQTPVSCLLENDLRRHEIGLVATYARGAGMKVRFSDPFAKPDETNLACEEVTTRNLPDSLTLAQGPDHRVHEAPSGRLPPPPSLPYTSG